MEEDSSKVSCPKVLRIQIGTRLKESGTHIFSAHNRSSTEKCALCLYSNMCACTGIHIKQYSFCPFVSNSSIVHQSQSAIEYSLISGLTIATLTNMYLIIDDTPHLTLLEQRRQEKELLLTFSYPWRGREQPKKAGVPQYTFLRESLTDQPRGSCCGESKNIFLGADPAVSTLNRKNRTGSSAGSPWAHLQKTLLRISNVLLCSSIGRHKL